MSQKNPLIVTPKGLLKYPRLFTPDTKFKAEGEYKTSLVLTPKEAAPLIKQLEVLHAEAYAVECAAKKKKALKKADLPWKKETIKNPDTEELEETGNIEFKASLRARVEPKGKEAWDQRPQVIDAAKKPVPKTVKVGSGTTAKLALEVSAWFNDAKGFGIQLRLKAVQIIDLVEFSGGDASGLFDEEDGYAAPDASEADFDEAPVGDEKPKTKGKTGDF